MIKTMPLTKFYGSAIAERITRLYIEIKELEKGMDTVTGISHDVIQKYLTARREEMEDLRNRRYVLQTEIDQLRLENYIIPKDSPLGIMAEKAYERGTSIDIPDPELATLK